MSKKIAILQSNYIPWKGYFDIISRVDEFIFYDEVQYTKNDWRNRNKIKTPSGPAWLTIPVRQHSLSQKISETRTTGNEWAIKHWKTIENNYRKAPYFSEYAGVFSDFYSKPASLISDVNRTAIELVNSIIGINTRLTSSADYRIEGDRNERLISLVSQAGGSVYLSGPAAKDYLDEELFRKKGIEIQWMDYSTYPEYPQLFPPFEHGVSIIDLIFNTGNKAADYFSGRHLAF